jgi:hypothetical protein
VLAIPILRRAAENCSWHRQWKRRWERKRPPGALTDWDDGNYLVLKSIDYCSSIGIPVAHFDKTDEMGSGIRTRIDFGDWERLSRDIEILAATRAEISIFKTIDLSQQPRPIDSLTRSEMRASKAA